MMQYGTNSATLPSAGTDPIDADAQAWADEVVVQGGLVSSERLTAVSDYITALKAAEIWDLYDRHWVWRAENVTAALVCMKSLALADNTDDVSFEGDVGFTGNASNDDIPLGVAPDDLTQWTVNSAHMSIEITNNRTTNNNYGDAGTDFSDGQSRFYPKYGDGNCYFSINRVWAGGHTAPAGTQGDWYLCGNATDCLLYQDDTLFATDTADAHSLSSTELTVLSSAGIEFTADTVGKVTLGAYLTAEQVAAANAAWEAYKAAIGL